MIIRKTFENALNDMLHDIFFGGGANPVWEENPEYALGNDFRIDLI